MPELAQKLIHLLIQSQLNRADIEHGCENAARHELYAVMLQPHYIETARRVLKETRVKIIALVGSTNGGTTTATKMYETQDALQRRADEIALIVNFGALRDREDLIVQNDIGSVVQTARGRAVTVILENFLSVEEKTRACRIAAKVKASFVQTSLGTTEHTLTLANVKVMTPAASLPVVASGKVDSLAEARALIEAGAARIAANAMEQIL